MLLTNFNYEAYFKDTCIKYNIDTPLRKAHFLAQIAHESGKFTRVSENLNYSEAGLVSTFGKYFSKDVVAGKKVAKDFAKKPEAIANWVYANRMGNGNQASGDGWKYRGKGLIQLTGKNTQSEYAKSVGIDITKSPDFLLTPKYAMDSAGWFWNKTKLNALADQDDIKAITKKINGGIIGYDDRVKNLLHYKFLFNIK